MEGAWDRLVLYWTTFVSFISHVLVRQTARRLEQSSDAMAPCTSVTPIAGSGCRKVPATTRAMSLLLLWSLSSPSERHASKRNSRTSIHKTVSNSKRPQGGHAHKGRWAHGACARPPFIHHAPHSKVPSVCYSSSPRHFPHL